MKYVLLLCLLVGLHFRPPIEPPTIPHEYGTDLANLEISAAPKDAKIVFLGDSITERWRFRQDLWERSFGKLHPANIGVSGSRTANLLWLVNSGKLSVFHPDVFVVRIGVNDLHGPKLGFFERRRPSVEQVEAGMQLIAESLHRQFPEARIILTPLDVPAGDSAVDGIHLNDSGYEHWAASLTESEYLPL